MGSTGAFGGCGSWEAEGGTALGRRKGDTGRGKGGKVNNSRNLPAVTVKDLHPTTKSCSVLVRCCKISPTAVHHPHGAQSLARDAIVGEALVGDETGVVIMKCTQEQASTLSFGFAVWVHGSSIQ